MANLKKYRRPIKLNVHSIKKDSIYEKVLYLNMPLFMLF